MCRGTTSIVAFVGGGFCLLANVTACMLCSVNAALVSCSDPAAFSRLAKSPAALRGSFYASVACSYSSNWRDTLLVTSVND